MGQQGVKVEARLYAVGIIGGNLYGYYRVGSRCQVFGAETVAGAGVSGSSDRFVKVESALIARDVLSVVILNQQSAEGLIVLAVVSLNLTVGHVGFAIFCTVEQRAYFGQSFIGVGRCDTIFRLSAPQGYVVDGYLVG